MIFNASKGVSVKILTLVCILVLVYLGYRNIAAILNSNGNTNTILIHSIVPLSFLILIVGCYLFAPQKYSVEDGELKVHRPWSDKIIAISAIKDIREVDKNDMKGMIRTFGVGGLFGNYGKFYSGRLGNVTFYATQNRNYVLITTDSNKIMITPDDLSLIDEVKKYNSILR